MVIISLQQDIGERLDLSKTEYRKKKRVYVPVTTKFYMAHSIAFLWVLISIYLSLRWVKDLGEVVSLPVAILIITGIAYIPGYLNAFLVSSLLMDSQPEYKIDDPDNELTILIAAYNEEKGIEGTLSQIAKQEYMGEIRIILIDNNSTDNTSIIAHEIGKKLNLNLTVITEKMPGKHHALNTGLRHVTTEYVITLDADTLLHPQALHYIMRRMLSSPPDVCSVAGAVLVRNSRENMLARIQEWDYFLAIASVKRLQGLYQQTLVAQGAFSLYKTEVVREVSGWPDVIGEDIVLTWRFLQKGYRVYFEPLSVAFTDVPTSLVHFVRQRSRWARGMIEALKTVKPWQQPMVYGKYLTGVNLAMPLIDVAYTFAWIPGVVLAFFGIFWIVGPLSLLVLPFTFISYYMLYRYQKHVFRSLGLKVRRNIPGLILFTISYQVLMSPISVWGYCQELFRLKRVWK